MIRWHHKYWLADVTGKTLLVLKKQHVGSTDALELLENIFNIVFICVCICLSVNIHARPRLSLHLPILFMLTRDWTTQPPNHHTEMPLANQAWDVVNKTGPFPEYRAICSMMCADNSAAERRPALITAQYSGRETEPTGAQYRAGCCRHYTPRHLVCYSGASRERVLSENRRSRLSGCIEIQGIHFLDDLNCT